MSGRPSRARFPVQGIDVSHHQGAIDWMAVAAAGVDFAYLKATEGGDFRDTRFAENWAGARRAGLIPGAYHYYRFGRDPAEQAAHVIATVPCEARMLPPAVDVELSGPFPDIPSDATFAAGFGEFLRLVEAHFGRKPVIYAPADAHARLLAGRFLDRPFWCRSIGRAPALADRDWTFWQHDDAGSCPGIAGSVDRDVFAGSRSAFGAFVGTADA